MPSGAGLSHMVTVEPKLRLASLSLSLFPCRSPCVTLCLLVHTGSRLPPPPIINTRCAAAGPSHPAGASPSRSWVKVSHRRGSAHHSSLPTPGYTGFVLVAPSCALPSSTLQSSSIEAAFSKQARAPFIIYIYIYNFFALNVRKSTELL